ncbi:MAG TPA: zf-HC2 domain-containing protein [Pyrinomonadaceae bacterium]
MRDCIEEGVLQSYIDNELSADAAKSVAAHIAACQTCAEALNEANAETMLFSTALEAEMNWDVPTVRLRERIDSAIAELNRPAVATERKQRLGLGAWLSTLAASFKVSPQRAVGFASLIAVIAFAAIFAAIKLRPTATTNNEPEFIASNPTDNPKTKPSPTPEPRGNPTPTPDDRTPDSAPSKNNKQKKQPKPILVPQPDQLQRDELAVKPLPGEEDYLKAIDSLTTEIAEGGAEDMKPSLRSEYERNLAVVDQAIDATRRAARRNPRDTDAAQFLYSSYQSKLDLLNAVAQQVRPTIATR